MVWFIIARASNSLVFISIWILNEIIDTAVPEAHPNPWSSQIIS